MDVPTVAGPDYLLLLARLLHVGLGVFWAGTIVFSAIFLTPSIRDAGPDGAKVAAGLMQRRFLDVMPVVALLTILAGLYLLWRASGSFDPAYFHSGIGLTLTVGAVASLVAFAIGAGVMRPAMLGAASVSRQAAAAAPEARDGLMQQAQALRVRAAAAGRIVAWLLGIATVTMAVARYV